MAGVIRPDEVALQARSLRVRQRGLVHAQLVQLRSREPLDEKRNVLAHRSPVEAGMNATYDGRHGLGGNSRIPGRQSIGHLVDDRLFAQTDHARQAGTCLRRSQSLLTRPPPAPTEFTQPTARQNFPSANLLTDVIDRCQ